jgi:hypothetical protein
MTTETVTAWRVLCHTETGHKTYAIVNDVGHGERVARQALGSDYGRGVVCLAQIQYNNSNEWVTDSETEF